MVWAVKLALRRLLAGWRSLLTVIAGALLAAAVGALIPLYTAAVAQVSMVEYLARMPLHEAHAVASIALVPAQTPFAESAQTYDSALRGLVDATLRAPFPGWLAGLTFYGETSALDVLAADETPLEARALLSYYEDWPARVRLATGRYPTTPGDPSVDLEIVVPFEAQTELDLKVDDRLILDQGGPRGGWPTSRNLRALVVGIAEPAPAGDPYFMAPSPLRLSLTGGTYRADFAVLTTRESLEQAALSFVPDTPTRIGWRLAFDHTRLPFTSGETARAALLDFENDLAQNFREANGLSLNLVYFTRLIHWTTQNGLNADQGALLTYERSIRSLDAPFTLLLLQIGALVLFFLMVTAALVRRGERREIAMLQSRGAADRGVTLIRGAEAILICAGTALIAPFAAQQLLILITPFFARYPNLPLEITPTVFAFSAAAALAAFGALLMTLRPVLRMPLVAAGGVAQRSARQPWWQRYYLDVVVAALGVVALLRLVSRESPLFTTGTGSGSADPFVLLAPGLLFLGIGSALLRMFPLLAGLVARLLGAGRGLLGPLAAWQLSREPLHYGRITFLLALAVGIGWFATSFRATVDRSQGDQAAYRVGADVRFDERDLTLNAARARPEAVYTALPGVEAASTGWRRANVNFQGDPNRPPLIGTILAVEPDSFGAVAHWREDLGLLNLPENVPLPERGRPLPFSPQSLSVWARFDALGAFGQHAPDLDRLRGRITIFARLLDAEGRWINVPFRLAEVEYQAVGPVTPGLTGGGGFTTTGWARFSASVPAFAGASDAPPRLVSLYWTHRGRSQNGERFLRLYLAGLRGTDSAGIERPIDLLDEAWEFAFDSGALTQGETQNLIPDGGHGRGVLVQWDQQAETGRLGMLLNYPALENLPAVISASLAARFRLEAEGPIRLRNFEGVNLTLQARAVNAYYPTLYDAELREGDWQDSGERQAFVVVARDALLYALNRRPSAALYPDEVWIRAVEGADPAAILEAARPADRRATLLDPQTLPGQIAALQTDPLSRGLLGLMLLAFLLAMALSVVSLLSYAALTVASRRSEFGVLRALGLNPLGAVAQLAAEQLFVVALGAIIGGVLGAVLSSQVVPRLAQDSGGAQIVPPFIVQAESAALAQYGLALAAVIGAVIALSLALVGRMSLGQTLRLGED